LLVTVVHEADGGRDLLVIEVHEVAVGVTKAGFV